MKQFVVGATIDIGPTTNRFINTTPDSSNFRVRAALRFERALNTIGDTRAIIDRLLLGHLARGVKQFVVGATIDIGLRVKNEIRVTKRPIFSFTFLPHRNMRRYLLFSDDPIEHLGGPIGGVTNETAGILHSAEWLPTRMDRF